MASWLVEEIEPATMDRIEGDVTRMFQCLMFAPKKIPSCARKPTAFDHNKCHHLRQQPAPLSQTHGSSAAAHKAVERRRS
jgi:hypothetical protein